MTGTLQPAEDVGRLINLLPVALKEAAIDSPTARASVIHYAEQVDLLEKWLDDYVKSTSRVVAESSAMDAALNSWISNATLPTALSESMLDHDYSTLAMKKYVDGAKAYWMSMLALVKRLNAMVVEPIKQFLQYEIKVFKEARRTVETSQKTFENLQSKYMALGKSKESSSLREEAFQLHEARKIYLKAMMDFFTMAPQFRFTLDKLMVKVFCDQWKELRLSRETTAASFQRNAEEMQRVRGWMNEMDTSEKNFRKELFVARKQLEEAAELNSRPSRELEDYAISTIPQYTSTHAATGSVSTVTKSPRKAFAKTGEKQGWLYLRTYTGKPTRTVWVRRWAFIRNGVFGWLLQSSRPGGVEESERIGVLLCGVRSAPAEERRFCFELKTNKNTIVLQAETQFELVDWIGAFETAKSKAVEAPDGPSRRNAQSNAAFSISPPPVPEFGAFILHTTEPGAAGDEIAELQKTNTLPIPGSEHLREASVDLARRGTSTEESGHRETASRIISKLDLHRKSPASPQVSSSPSTPNLPGGIASLIASTHGSMPVGPSIPMVHALDQDFSKPLRSFTLALRDMPPNTLAPSTLASVPTPTNLSRSAVVVTGERGLGAAPEKTGIPPSLLANMWGTSSTAAVNQLERGGDPKVPSELKIGATPSPALLPTASPPKASASPSRPPIAHHHAISQLDLSLPQSSPAGSRAPSPSKRHRNTISLDREAFKQVQAELLVPEFPSHYPLQLKSQDAQYRLLFPNVRRDERLVMVFRATWNPNDQQEFPGRIYVTPGNVYFYSNHFGLVLTSSVPLAAIDEATAAPGRDCDFIFLHLRDAAGDGSARRITVKVFLEPLRLVQRRLNFLIKNAVADEPQSLDDLVQALIKMETEAPDRSPSLESWEDVSVNTPVDSWGPKRPGRSNTFSEVKLPLRVDRDLHQRGVGRQEDSAKFKLPAQPVKYVPTGNLDLAVEKEFDISAKALFHVMFGDKSALWQLLQHERHARNLTQGPWLNLGEGVLRREFAFDIPRRTLFRSESLINVRDYQVVDVNSDHLCYVVTDKRTPWHLPYQSSHRLVSKVVITHVAKAKCKLAIFCKVEWLRATYVPLLRGLIERQALYDLELDSLDLADLVADQVRKLGAHSRTRKAVQIFGQVGHSTETTQLLIDATALNIELRRAPTSRSVTGLLLQTAASSAQSAAAMALDALLNLLAWVARTCSAQRVLLLALALSAFYNGWHTYRDGVAWYHERRAAGFMARLGVSPNVVMSRAVYLADLDEMLWRTDDAATAAGVAGACYHVFADEHDPDGVGVDGASHGRGRAAQVQATRQRLGTYRHDLAVAVRVVNGIEREVVRNAWEGWVAQEARRCEMVGSVLEMAEGGGGSGNATDGVHEWYQEYCASCRDEYRKLRGIEL